MGIRSNPEGTGWWAYERDLGRVSLFIDDVDDLVTILSRSARSVTIKAEGVIIDSASDLAGASKVHLRTLKISTANPYVDVYLQPDHAAVRSSDKTPDATLLAVTATDFFRGKGASRGQRLLVALRRGTPVAAVIFFCTILANAMLSINTGVLTWAGLAIQTLGALVVALLLPVLAYRVLWEAHGAIVRIETRTQHNTLKRKNLWTVAGWLVTTVLAAIGGFVVAVLTR